MELLTNIGLNTSCIVMFLIMAFLVFGQKLIDSPEAEEEKITDFESISEIAIHETLMSHK